MGRIHRGREGSISECPEILRTIRAFIDKTDFAITGILHLVLIVRIWCENNISREVDVLNTVVIRDRKDTRLLRRRSCGKGHV